MIDYLHDDMASLCEASLVCRAWLPTSSYHLFDRLAWPPCFHAWEEWTTRRCRCRAIDQTSFWLMLLAFCRDSTRIRYNVRRLRVRFRWTVVDPEAQWNPLHYRTRITTTDLLTVAKLLPALRHLELVQLDLSPTPGLLEQDSESRVHALDKLVLVDPGLTDCDQFDGKRIIHFFCLFTVISTLILSSVWNGVFAPPHAALLVLASTFDTVKILELEIKDGFPPATVQFLRVLSVVADLRSLSRVQIFHTVGWLSEALVDHASSFLRSAPNLRILSLDAAGYSNLLNVSSVAPNLRILALRCHLNVDFSDRGVENDAHTTNWPTVFNILSNAVVPSLEVVSIQLILVKLSGPSIPGVEYDNVGKKVGIAFEGVDWSLLDRAVSMAKTVTLEITLNPQGIPLCARDETIRVMQELPQNRISAKVLHMMQVRLREAQSQTQ